MAHFSEWGLGSGCYPAQRVVTTTRAALTGRLKRVLAILCNQAFFFWEFPVRHHHAWATGLTAWSGGGVHHGFIGSFESHCPREREDKRGQEEEEIKEGRMTGLSCRRIHGGELCQNAGGPPDAHGLDSSEMTSSAVFGMNSPPRRRHGWKPDADRS